MASGAEPVLSQAEVDAAFAAASQEIAKRLAAASAAAAPLPAPAPAADELAGLDDILDLDAALNALDVSASAEAAAAAPAEQPKAASAVSAEVQEKIIAQVEFYFSDENLPTDEFLLSRVKQNKQGWVHLGVIARFHKMKKYCKGDWAVLGEVLKASTKLEISPRGTHVRRRDPLPKTDLFEVAARTCVAENLPENPTADSVSRLFSSAGPVRMVRVCPPTSSERSAKSTLQAAAQQAAERDPGGALAGALAVVSTQVHALVEFETEAAARNAVKTLNDVQNWRSGLRVRLVYKGAVHKTQQVTDGCDGADPDAEEPVTTQPTAAEGGDGPNAAGGATPPAKGAAGAGQGKKGRGREPKKNYAQWAAAGSYKQMKEKEERERAAGGGDADASSANGARAASAGDASASAPAAEGAGTDSGAAAEGAPQRRRFFIGAKGRAGAGDAGDGAGGAPGASTSGGGAAGGGVGGGGPAREAKMPDGSRGFSMGRGTRLAPPIGARAAPDSPAAGAGAAGGGGIVPTAPPAAAAASPLQ